MRVISGSLRSRIIPTSGFHGTRPTTDRARETTFNILANECDMDAASVLDLCAGTGALGIEALSRGAARAVFVDKSRSNARLLQQTLEQFHLTTQTRVLAADALQALSLLASEQATSSFTFSLIFCDPPYAAKLINSVFSALARGGLVAHNGVFVAEHDARETVLLPEGWQKLTERAFGETVIEFFQKF
jgi:16S rRNA (guanine(966)-N(2))-methyltransferase RsmD